LSSPLLRSKKGNHFACRPCKDKGKATRDAPFTGECAMTHCPQARCAATRRSQRPCACVKTPDARTGRSCWFPLPSAAMWPGSGTVFEHQWWNADMNANRKSDGPIVPAKRANKAGTPVAEPVEERGSPKGKPLQPTRAGHRTGLRGDGLSVATAGRDFVILTVIPKGRAV
jgi:hypothetical protein